MEVLFSCGEEELVISNEGQRTCQLGKKIKHVAASYVISEGSYDAEDLKML